MKKLFLLFLFLGASLLPTTAFAQLDQRCWTEKACNDARERDTLGVSSETENGFYAAENHKDALKGCGAKKNASGQKLGFCLPGTSSETTIAFGGKTAFIHIGEYIEQLYVYGIIAAGILSVVMIIAAGFIWITSGGNSERIQSAKKRIGGAVVGLVLALLSYTLLNTLNPSLVNLRLPQLWMINTQGLAPSYCDQNTDPNKRVEKIAFSTESIAAKSKKAKILASDAKTVYSTTSTAATCGLDYVVEGSGGLMCRGRSCAGKKGNMCLEYTIKNKQRVFAPHCVNSSLIISAQITSLKTQLLSSISFVKAFIETVQNEWIDQVDDNPILWPVCKKGARLFKGTELAIPWTDITKMRTKGDASLVNRDMFDYLWVFPKFMEIYKNHNWCGNVQGSIFEGLFVQMEMKEAGDWTDPDFWIGQAEPKEKNPTIPVLGTWLGPNEQGEEITFTDYIPKENLDKGVFLQVEVTEDLFQTIETYTGSARQNRMPAHALEKPAPCLDKNKLTKAIDKESNAVKKARLQKRLKDGPLCKTS